MNPNINESRNVHVLFKTFAYNKLQTSTASAEAGMVWKDMPTWPNVTDMLQKQDKAQAIKGLHQ